MKRPSSARRGAGTARTSWTSSYASLPRPDSSRRHLYNFFVADEPQVPAWKDTPPRDMEAIRTLGKAFIENNYEIRPVLRVLFNSDFFKNARFTKVKSPAEVVMGTMRLVKDHTEVKPGLRPIATECVYMGQALLNPPTVEGWHTGREWIDSGTLVERINFVADQVGNMELPRHHAHRRPDELRCLHHVTRRVCGRLPRPDRPGGGQREDPQLAG